MVMDKAVSVSRVLMVRLFCLKDVEQISRQQA
jgi:hypothetical protein